MIAVDTSALLAILLNEPEAPLFAEILTENDCIVGLPTRFEAWLVVATHGTPADIDRLDMLFRPRNVEMVPFSLAHLTAAQAAFARFGKGKHRAKLNFGDCVSYAVAQCANAPLLYKGEDFAATDIPAASMLR